MSEPKRANLITVDSAKGEKKKVTKTTRLDIDLFHSNEKEYPAFNYKELVRFEEGKSNGASKSENPPKNGDQGPDPFSDNDEDVERIAKQFEQKYGSASTYGKTKGRSKEDDYADIGAGYDENDSFIDNTDGYDEMIPPEADTVYGGFYINCGALEFTSAPYQHDENEDPNPIRRNNKRAISSSTSGDESSESSGSESDTTEEPEKSTDGDKKSEEVHNGIVSHKSSDRKKSKSEKRHEKKRHKRVRRDGPETSDKDARNKMDVDDVQPVTDGGSADQEMSTDSRTSDSALSKPAPSSDNAATSESSRDAAVQSGSEEGQSTETALPVSVAACVESIRTLVSETRARNHGLCTLPHLQPRLDHLLKELDSLLRGCLVAVRRAAWGVAARAVGQSRARLQKQARLLRADDTAAAAAAANAASAANAATASTPSAGASTDDDAATAHNTDAIMSRLKKIINTMRPSLIKNYNQECQRIHDANKKIAAQNAAMEVDRRIPERRLPKRTFPWNDEVRLLLSELVRSCGASWKGSAGGAGGAASREEAAAVFLRDSVLPLFPQGFVRMPTLLQQASLSKDQKIPNTDPSKRYKLEKIYPPTVAKTVNTNNELENVTPHQLPTSTVAPDKLKNDKTEAPLNSILSSLNLPANTNVTIEKSSKQPTYKEDKTEINIEGTRSDKYTPPNSIGCITITPVNNTQRFDTKTTKLVNSVTITASPPKGPDVTEMKGIRVKSPSELMKPLSAVSDKNKSTSVTPVISARDDKMKTTYVSPVNSTRDDRSKSTSVPSVISVRDDKMKSTSVIPVNSMRDDRSKSSSVTPVISMRDDKIQSTSVTSVISRRDDRIKSTSVTPVISARDDKIKSTSVTPVISVRDDKIKSARDDSNKKDKHHTSKHKSSHDKVKQIHRTKSPSAESHSSKESRKSLENTNLSKSDSTRNVNSPDFVKKKLSSTSKSVDETSVKFVTEVKSGKESNEKSRPHATQRTTQSANDTFVKPTDKIRLDSNSKNYKIRDDPVKITLEKDPLSEIMDVSDSSSDVELIEETPPQNHVNSTKPHLKKDEKTKQVDVTKKSSETVRTEKNVDAKQNSVTSKTVSVPKTSRKDTDGFVEPIPKRSKTGNGMTVTVDSESGKSDSGRTEEIPVSVGGDHEDEKVSENSKKEDDINHYDIKKVMQDLKELQKSQEVPVVADDMFYSRPDKKSQNTFSAPHFDMFHDSSSADNKSDPKSLENSNHSITSG